MERYFKFSELSKLEQKLYYNYIYLFLMEANIQYPAKLYGILSSLPMSSSLILSAKSSSVREITNLQV